MSIYGNIVGGGGSGLGKTLIFEDEAGNSFVGVVTDSVKMFDATPADVKIGKTFVSDSGIAEGTDTKTYRTTHAYYLIFPGERFSVPLIDYDSYDYTQLQAMIAMFNTTILDSMSVVKVALYDYVYDVNSNDKLSHISKDKDSKSVDFGITNNTGNIYIVHYNTYKEE